MGWLRKPKMLEMELGPVRACADAHSGEFRVLGYNALGWAGASFQTLEDSGRPVEKIDAHLDALSENEAARMRPPLQLARRSLPR